MHTFTRQKRKTFLVSSHSVMNYMTHLNYSIFSIQNDKILLLFLFFNFYNLLYLSLLKRKCRVGIRTRLLVRSTSFDLIGHIGHFDIGMC